MDRTESARNSTAQFTARRAADLLCLITDSARGFFMLIYQRGKIYQLRKRVLPRHASIEARQTIKVSMHTVSESVT